MLYSFEDTQNMVLLIYEYLQSRLKKQARIIKMFKPAHEKAVKNFVESLPPTAGVDFIWDFLLLQFYVFTFQEQERKPMPTWFFGKEAWKRWRNYDDGVKYYVQNWARDAKLINPIKSKKFESVAEDVFRKERFRMSRISGADFCFLKYGDNPYDSEDEMCSTCPFKKSCEIIFNGSGQTVYEQAVKNVSDEDGSRVRIREKILYNNDYEEEV